MGENRIMCDLYKENQRLKERIKELEAKHWNECGQIAHYSDELRKAKRLLKAAVEDFSYIGSTGTCIGGNCERCPLEGEKQNSRYACTNWKHEAEALALLGKDIDVPASKDDTNVGHKSGGWISCKDYMPDTLERALSTMYSDCCLVCDAFGWVGMAYYITDGQKSWWEFADAQNKNKIDWTEVTHWQPLPEPPKDGDTNG